jgi:hypothetical protein
MASMAFMIRLIRTCCSCTRSAIIPRKFQGQFDLKRDAVSFQFTVKYREDLANNIADAYQGLFAAIPSEHRPDACNNLSGTMAIVDDTFQDVAHLIQIGIPLCKQKEYLISRGDAVIAVKNETGNIKLNQLVNTTAIGAAKAASGDCWWVSCF